jgi:hypothetical protein
MHIRASRSHRLPTVFGIVAVLGLSCLDVTQGAGPESSVKGQSARSPQRTAQLPVTFVENTGRVDPRVRYYAQS